MVEMKKVWTRPLTVVQNFEPNEYCASSCGERGTVYKFKCDATGGGILFDGGFVYQETNGEDGLQRGEDQLLGAYSPCDETHEASTSDVFVPGYISYFGNVTPVMIWTNNGTNVHCTRNVHMDTWETAKS